MIFLSAVFLLLATPHPALSRENYIYREIKGDDCSAFVWDYRSGTPGRLSAGNPDERHLTLVNDDLVTEAWEIHRPAARTRLFVERRDNSLNFSGTKEGKPIGESVAIDDAPWFQAMSLSLRLMLEDRQEIRFWTIRPDNYDVLAMRAKKIGIETITHEGTDVETVHVAVRPEGWRSAFWKGDYWLRKSDGVFLKYTGGTAIPGSNCMVVKVEGYRSPEEACKD